MDIIESIKRDKAYVKCKLIVKNWEKEFKTKYSRTPSKFDIKEAPSNIKYAYKKYFQLKSAALENSLSVCDLDDEPFGSPELSLPLDSVTDNTPHQELSLPLLPTSQELDKILQLSHSQHKIQESSPFTENLSKKLFQNRKFALRNPRKLSLSKSLSVQDSSINNGSKENCDETFSQPESCTEVFSNELQASNSTLTINSKNEMQNDAKFCTKLNFSNIKTSDYMKTIPVRQINTSWLERATGLTSVDCENPTNVSTTKFGLTNIAVTNVDKPCDYVENSESEEDNMVLSKLKPALKKMKTEIKEVSEKIEDRHTDQVFGDCDLKKTKSIRGQKKTLSQSKANQQSKKKTKNNGSDLKEIPPNIIEYMPFGLETDINPRHANVTDILNTIDSKTASSIPQILIPSESNKLEKKIQNGTINDNFVKVNIEKKVYVRGRKGINYSKYKKQLWKDKKALHAGMEFPESGIITCFKCGSTGHMARYCTGYKETALLPLNEFVESSSPTLQDMEAIVSKETQNVSVKEQLCSFVHQSSQIPEHFLKLLSATEATEYSGKIKPIYSFNDAKDTKEVHEALHMFGHDKFRPGQEQAILRILSGMSTLLILSTGGGKSLCYQLPAYIYSQHYKCITLVISPLVSLMEDQVLSMPEFLKAGCLHTNQTPTQRRKIIECLKNGEINILLISPEALISGDSSSGFAGLFKSLPQIAFACIDEVHCVSQWSHNFRPSYLMICRVLREKLNVKCILGLTATASQTTIKSIIEHINIPDELSGVVINPALPENLHLSISFEKDKDRALVHFISSERIESFTSVIVYCIRRNECERIAAILRSCLSQPGKINMQKENKKRKRMSYIAEAYHAGMSAAQRKKIQKHFMDGTLKIIVATVAFGMGINKSDIRCIIHYNMPPSFESYVQEVGRAGRDGNPAYCHVFLDNSHNDKSELLKHIYANSIDRPVIRKLLQKVFLPCKCIPDTSDSPPNQSSNLERCKGHEVGIPIDNAVEELDLPSENIATLLCYIELHYKHYIKVLNNAYTICKIASYGGPIKILEAAKTCPPLAMAYLLEGKKDVEVMKKSILEFNVIEVAAAIGWESGLTKYHLKNLEWLTKNGSTKRSHLKVEFNTLGFRIKAPGDLNPIELDNILDDLHNTVYTQEKAMLYQLEEINSAFTRLSNYSAENMVLSEDFLTEKSNELKSIINSYFDRKDPFQTSIVLEVRPLDTERAISDIRALISMYKDCKFTGRSIARIFQGISSPNYPALVWGRCRFWRAHIHEDFYGLVKLATQQIIQMM